MYEWLNLEEDEEPISYVMYGSYEEQMKYLTDEQLGRLMRNLMHYVKTGEQKTDEPIIDMALSMMANDIRNQKRNQKKRSDAAKIAAEASVESRMKDKAEKEAQKEAKTEAKKQAAKSTRKTAKKQSVGQNAASEPSSDLFSDHAPEAPQNDGQRFLTAASEAERTAAKASLYEDVDEDVDVNADVDVDVDVDADVSHKTGHLPLPSRTGAGASREAACEPAPDDWMRYGPNQDLTRRSVVAQMEGLAAELIRKYCGRTACENDVENVFAKSYTVEERPDGELYAVFSPERAELLRYAFKQAGDAGHVNWKYIEGIYDNFRERRISSVEEATACEYAWQRGEITG